jgi:prolyl-tRNA editing enzyme YbaK/EbsC (Cys-tRNA(Pro) deacylase)
MKVGEEFKLFVLSAAKKVDSQKIKDHFDEKKLRFATPEELKDLTGLVPGAVPPFGKPITPFDLHADMSITANEKIAFNAGSLTDSIIMSCKDYLKVALPEVFEFSV